jgi:hypothetical protein
MSPEARRLPSPRSQTSSQRSTSTPRNPGTFEEWQARQRQRLLAQDKSISGIISPIRGDQSVPAGTMYRYLEASELEAHGYETMASVGATRATEGSRSAMDLTGPSIINETEPTPSLRRAVTFNNVSEVVEVENHSSSPGGNSPTQRPEK